MPLPAPQDPWDQPLPTQLAEVLASITDISDMQRVLRDVMTEKEIQEISARLEAAYLLSQGTRYAEVIPATNLSSRTVARVSDWLTNGTGGYAIAIDIVKGKRQ
jgi:TrpR-related protein YerC/YecD